MAIFGDEPRFNNEILLCSPTLAIYSKVIHMNIVIINILTNILSNLEQKTTSDLVRIIRLEMNAPGICIFSYATLIILSCNRIFIM